MIIGHTTQANGITHTCNSKIWRVDVGISTLFGTNNMEVLEILDDGVSLPKNKFTPIKIIK